MVNYRILAAGAGGALAALAGALTFDSVVPGSFQSPKAIKATEAHAIAAGATVRAISLRVMLIYVSCCFYAALKHSYQLRSK
jgi:hypothetical protein